MERFTTFNITKALKIPFGRLREWLIKGFVQATLPSLGQGQAALFERYDVYGIALFRELLDHGFSREAAGRYVNEFMQREREEPAGQQTAYIVIREAARPGDPVTVINYAEHNWRVDLKTGEIPELKTVKGKADNEGYRMILIINFALLRKEVDAALKDL